MLAPFFQLLCSILLHHGRLLMWEETASPVTVATWFRQGKCPSIQWLLAPKPPRSSHPPIPEHATTAGSASNSQYAAADWQGSGQCTLPWATSMLMLKTPKSSASAPQPGKSMPRLQPESTTGSCTYRFKLTTPMDSSCAHTTIYLVVCTCNGCAYAAGHQNATSQSP
jgi:hypothetical protein